jgi:hypothetical protein
MIAGTFGRYPARKLPAIKEMAQARGRERGGWGESND